MKTTIYFSRILAVLAVISLLFSCELTQAPAMELIITEHEQAPSETIDPLTEVCTISEGGGSLSAGPDSLFRGRSVFD